MNQSAPKFIGKRIQVTKEKKALTIIIAQQVERWQEALLIAWLLAWLFCGCIFIYYLFTVTNRNETLFFLVLSSLWLFFMIRIAKVYFWRRGGREIITLRPGELTIKNAFWNKGKTEVYQIRNIFKLGPASKNNQSFFSFMDDSFWIIGGEKIGFSYSGRKRQFGKQLNIRDAEALTRMIDFGLKEFGKEN